VLAILASAAAIFPIYWMAVTALSPTGSLRAFPPRAFPEDPQWGVFQSVFETHDMALWIKNNLVIAGATLTLSLLIATLAAYALSRFTIRGARSFGLFILVAKMLPGTLLVIPLFIIFRSLGIIDSPASVVLAQCTAIVPFATWMLKGYFDTIPSELDQAALVDGCSPLGALWRVVLPVSAPGIAATALYALILSWSDFLFARTFVLRSAENWTLSMGIEAMRGEYFVDWNIMMAASLIGMAPIIVIYFLLERFLVGGLASGSQK
jgi:multiple sugar transport system permease protein